jgi:hypothetical protein
MNDSFKSSDDMKESFMTSGQKPLRPFGTPTPVGAS